MVPEGNAGMDTVLIAEERETAGLCHAQVSIKKTLKPFQLSCCSMKINGTTFTTVTSYISYVLSISQPLLPDTVSFTA